MRRGRFRSRCLPAGFSLVELAIVLFIVGILMLSLMSTLSSQVDQRNFDDTRRRLEQARELVLAFAIVNGRLPCPARSNSAGAEVRIAATGECKNTSGTVEDYYGGTLSDGTVGGLLPAVTIGFQPVDSAGFAVDAWGNRLRYAVAKTITGCGGTFPHFVHAEKLKDNGITCLPNDLVVCGSSVGINASSCNTAPSVTNQKTVALIVFSTGQNGAIASAYGGDETANLNGDPVFVSRLPSGSDAANGAYDDIMLWVPVGLLYGRLTAAGVLP